ncbi:hypothetical protein HPB51_009289 [Rhipicephalus microplus]|uniref:Uncharacterized protein n=1 Tax=Rhipicephalus microplus TaxID=6941 RepID=A0A9J6F0L1_RHIMP|nr:hypothetical protein HPB51_009289 [Rhipicephalus microplus]
MAAYAQAFPADDVTSSILSALVPVPGCHRFDTAVTDREAATFEWPCELRSVQRKTPTCLCRSSAWCPARASATGRERPKLTTLGAYGTALEANSFPALGGPEWASGAGRCWMQGHHSAPSMALSTIRPLLTGYPFQDLGASSSSERQQRRDRGFFGEDWLRPIGLHGGALTGLRLPKARLVWKPVAARHRACHAMRRLFSRLCPFVASHAAPRSVPRVWSATFNVTCQRENAIAALACRRDVDCGWTWPKDAADRGSAVHTYCFALAASYGYAEGALRHARAKGEPGKAVREEVNQDAKRTSSAASSPPSQAFVFQAVRNN